MGRKTTKDRVGGGGGVGAGGTDVRLAVGKSGFWELRWTEWDDAAGRARSRSQSCRTKDRVEAEGVKTAWVLATLQAQKNMVAAGLVSVADLMGAYMAGRGFAAGSTQDWAVRQIVAGVGGRLLEDLGPGVVSEYRRRRGVSVGDPTIRRELVCLRAALNWGRANGLVAADVQPVIALPPDGAARTRYLSEVEEKVVWTVALGRFTDLALPFRERRAALFVLIALETAARESAIRGLTWGRVDLGVGVIDFRDPNMKVTKKRRVPVPISDRLRPVLELAKAQAGVQAPGCAWVLRDPGAVRKGFEGLRATCMATGLVGRFSIHDMRRTWASLRVQWGVPLGEVAGVLGDGVEVVEKHYAHFSPGYLRNAVNKRAG